MKLKRESLRKTKDVQNTASMAFWETDVSFLVISTCFYCMREVLLLKMGA